MQSLEAKPKHIPKSDRPKPNIDIQQSITQNFRLFLPSPKLGRGAGGEGQCRV